MSRVAAAVKNVKELISSATRGDVMAALELAQLYRVESVSELVAVVCPEGGMSVATFDAVADGYALKLWKETV